MNENNLDKSKFLHDTFLSMKLNTAVSEMLNLDIQAKKAVSKLVLFVGTEKLNKIYVFTVRTLEILYEENPVLSSTVARPIWETIKILDDNFDSAVGLVEHQKHINELKRIWILEKRKNDIVELSSKELKFLEKINDEIKNVQKQLDEKFEKRDKFVIDRDKLYFKLERHNDYALYINGHFLIKPRGGMGERIIDEGLKKPNKKIALPIAKTSKTVVSIINDMKFDAKLRKLFFPLIREHEIILRPEIFGKDIINEQIDISGLEDWLK
ncbi:hypothetical protein J5491_01355 [Candidatus Saccharibacteria bacterium]|nr:hypothetical protein [Candidatus Saccharibacteria bacterium]